MGSEMCIRDRLTTTIFWSDSFQFSCIIMEYVSGENLLEHCYRRKNLRERLALFYDICTAVTYLHSRPIVHGDLTPDNILVDDDGTVKIVDFTLGVTCRSVSEQTRGLTKLYASPLQLANGTATVSCDIYTLGKLLQDLLFGVWPVGSKSSIKIPFYMKASILSIIAKATEIEPDNRYISVAVSYTHLTLPTSDLV